MKPNPTTPPVPTRRTPPAPGAAFNEVETVILTRRSVRSYQSKQVPDYLVRRVLEAGRFAPCAGNNQSWRFVVVRDAELIGRMTSQVQTWASRLTRMVDPTYPGTWTTGPVAAVMQRIFATLAPSSMHPTGLTGLAQVAAGKLGVWHGAPTVILLLADTRGAGKPLVDLGIAGQNMVLAAHSMGLGACWVSFSMFLQLSADFRRELGIEYPYKLVTSLALGFPAGQPDGFVDRETHETLWIDTDGQRSVVT